MGARTDTTLDAVLADGIEPFKGLLILIVVMDHNDVAHALFPATFRPLTFHVLGFLLLPFLVRVPRLSWMFVLDRFARYWIPFATVMTIASVLYWLGFHRDQTFSRFVVDYLLGLTFGSAPLVKKASGFLAYWFLPALLGLVVVLSAYETASRGTRRIMIVLFALAHLMLVAGTFGGYYWVPFGIAIVANVFVLGLILRAVTRLRVGTYALYLFTAIFLISYGWLVARGAWLEVMSLRLAAVTEVTTFIAQDVAALSGIGSMILLAGIVRRNRFFVSIGRHSLMIYLLHPLVYSAILLLMMRAGWMGTTSSVSAVVFGIVSYAVALLVSWLAAALLAASPAISAWITPRKWKEWRPIAAFSPTPIAARVGSPMDRPGL